MTPEKKKRIRVVKDWIETRKKQPDFQGINKELEVLAAILIQTPRCLRDYYYTEV